MKNPDEREQEEEEPTYPEVVLNDGRKITFEGTDSRRQHWAVLARVLLHNANFQRRDYDGFDFSGLDLTGTILIACDFSHALLVGTIIENAQGDGALFAAADFRRCRVRATAFPDASFNEALIQGCAWEHVNAMGATFDDADMRTSRFTNCNFCAASLEGVVATNASFLDTDLSGCCLDDADLTGVRLVKTNLSGASLRGTCLKNAIIGETKFANADLSGADLSDVVYEGYNHCDFTGLKLNGTKNVAPDFHTRGTLQELDPLLRRSGLTFNYDDGIAESAMRNALSKLWLDHALSGTDILLQPIDDLMDAAHSIAVAVRASKPDRR